jgi:hypothetical protein
VTAVRPKITGIDMGSVSLAFDVDINNPYLVPLRSSNVRYAFDVEGSQLFESDEPVTGNHDPAGPIGSRRPFGPAKVLPRAGRPLSAAVYRLTPTRGLGIIAPDWCAGCYRFRQIP